MTGSCPPEDELVRMVEGALADASMIGLESHIAACEHCAAVVANLAALAPEGRDKAFGRYQLDRLIAAGGMGEVWAGWDPQLRREIAIKIVRPDRADDDRERARLLREARALAMLTHPNVLAVHDVGEVDGELFLATELVSGSSLATVGGPTADWRPTTALYVQAARGLAAAHAAGLVHRDVKPDNLLLGADGRVRVADFGLAIRGAARPTVSPLARTESAAPEPSITRSGHIAGTPAYMAPEQRPGVPADARTDQYALCIALVEAISGRRPDGELDPRALIAFVSERRPREPALDALCWLLARGLARDPAERFSDMTALADAIEGVIAPVASASRRRRPRWPIAVVAVVVAGAGTAVWHATGSEPAARQAVPAAAPARAAATTTDTGTLIVRVHAASDVHDAPACLAAVTAIPPPLDPRMAAGIDALRAQCLMIAGRCDEGSALAVRAYAAMGMPTTAEQQVAVLVRGYCPITGPLEERLLRLQQQTMLHIDHPAWCELLVAPARQAGREAASGYHKSLAGRALADLARCVSYAGHCDDAHQLAGEAARLGMPRAELGPACK